MVTGCASSSGFLEIREPVVITSSITSSSASSLLSELSSCATTTNEMRANNTNKALDQVY